MWTDETMNRREQERALVGAALLDEAVARLLLTELREHELIDPTARLTWWALRRSYEPGRAIEEELEEAVRQDELEEFWAAVEGRAPDLDDEPAVNRTDLEIVVEALDCAGLLVAAGGADAVAALVVDRPALRSAMASAGAAVKAMKPVTEEPLIAAAASMLGAHDGA